MNRGEPGEVEGSSAARRRADPGVDHVSSVIPDACGSRVDHELIAVDLGRLMREAGASEALEEGRVEHVRHLRLAESEASCERGRQHGGAHRLFGREREAEVAEEGDAREQIPRRVAPISR